MAQGLPHNNLVAVTKEKGIHLYWKNIHFFRLVFPVPVVRKGTYSLTLVTQNMLYQSMLAKFLKDKGAPFSDIVSAEHAMNEFSQRISGNKLKMLPEPGDAQSQQIRPL